MTTLKVLLDGKGHDVWFVHPAAAFSSDRSRVPDDI
jgi:hypothetical protein